MSDQPDCLSHPDGPFVGLHAWFASEIARLEAMITGEPQPAPTAAEPPAKADQWSSEPASDSTG